MSNSPENDMGNDERALPMNAVSGAASPLRTLLT
jgi:hypothetical protein